MTKSYCLFFLLSCVVHWCWGAEPLSPALGANPLSNLRFGAVLDVAHSSAPLALSSRDEGLQLGHSDVVVSGNLSPYLQTQWVANFETEEGKLENQIEEAWLQSRQLPHGLQVRAGRFSSQIGYLNEQHSHADDFLQRPLSNRGLLGGHLFDDGIRLNWTAPTPFYLRIGGEVFGGRVFVPTSTNKGRLGTLSVKTGGDWGENQSWQLGLSQLNNKRSAPLESHSEDSHDGAHEEGHEDAHEEEHNAAQADAGHSHAAVFAATRIRVLDFVWKWAPSGQPKDHQVRVLAEMVQGDRLHPEARGLTQSGKSLAAVWRLHPSWEVGVRADRLQAYALEEDEGVIVNQGARLHERSVMLAYRPTHLQTLRLQWTQQNAKNLGTEARFSPARQNSLQLQYILSFGAHGAHSF